MKPRCPYTFNEFKDTSKSSNSSSVSSTFEASRFSIILSLFLDPGIGATITPAGEQFIATIRDVNSQIKRVIEHGQNFSAKYRDNIRVVMSVRSALFYLPEVIKAYRKDEPSISITPLFDYYNYLDSFVSGQADIVFTVKDRVRHMPDIQIFDLYDSHLYLVCNSDDPLAKKKIIKKDDLKGRTLMVGGGSMSHDHNPQFAWIPFDTDITFSCVLCVHGSDTRKSVIKLVEMLREYYKDKKLKL